MSENTRLGFGQITESLKNLLVEFAPQSESKLMAFGHRIH